MIVSGDACSKEIEDPDIDDETYQADDTELESIRNDTSPEGSCADHNRVRQWFSSGFSSGRLAFRRSALPAHHCSSTPKSVSDK